MNRKRAVETERGITFRCTIKKSKATGRLKCDFNYSNVGNLGDFLELIEALKMTADGMHGHVMQHFTQEELSDFEVALKTPLRFKEVDN